MTNIEKLIERMGWQPIESAPKDKRIIVHSPKYKEDFIVFWAINMDDGKGNWVICRGEKTTFIVRGASKWHHIPTGKGGEIIRVLWDELQYYTNYASARAALSKAEELAGEV